MRIALLVNRDIASNFALNLLLPTLGSRVVAIFLSERVGAPRPPSLLDALGYVEQDLWNRFVFPGLAKATPLPGSFLSFDAFETQLGIPVRPIASLRQPAGLDALRAAAADLFVSIRFGHVLREEAIAIPPLGILNLHSGLLPAYRGVLATLRALDHGDTTIGPTLHYIDSPGLDVGPIVARGEVPVDANRSLLAHILAIYPVGVPLITAAIAQLEAGATLATTVQDPQAGGYYTFPTEAEVLAFLAKGWRLFDRRDLEELLARYHYAP